jgi:hypothetical protein
MAAAPTRSASGLEPNMAAAPVCSAGGVPVEDGPLPDEVERVAVVMVEFKPGGEMTPVPEAEATGALVMTVLMDDSVVVVLAETE